MKKVIKKAPRWALKQLERASRYIVICVIIIALTLQLTVYSQWGVMARDLGTYLIELSGQETVQAENTTVETGL